MNGREADIIMKKKEDTITHIINLVNDILSKSSYMKMYVLSLGIIIVMVFSGIMIVNAGVGNKNINTGHKYYTSIDIESNDTLWSIANKYTNGSEDISSYINEVKNINKMSNDQIYSGQHLIIYYYTQEVQ